MNLSFPGFGVDERISTDASQWFSPPEIAWRMACLAGSPPQGWRVLEPSAGSGNLVRAALDRCPGCTVDAFELDPYYADVLRDRFAGDRVTVESSDFLESDHRDDDPYDLAIMNPPFEDGLDGRFLAEVMHRSLRVIALVRLAALAGQGRYEDVWSQVGDGKPWRMSGLYIFSGRPSFQAGRAIGDRENGGSAKADFCVVRLSRVPTGPHGTEVGWW